MAQEEERRVPSNTDEFVRWYKPFVRARVLKLNRGQATPTEMKDIEQAVWCRLLEYDTLGKYMLARGSFPAFLNTAVYNASWNIRRARKKFKREVLLTSSPGAEEKEMVTEFEILCTDGGEGCQHSEDVSELKALDDRLASFLNGDERASLYRRVQHGESFVDLIFQIGLDPEEIEAILEEVL